MVNQPIQLQPKGMAQKYPCTATTKTLRSGLSLALLWVLRSSPGAECKAGNLQHAADKGRLWKTKEPSSTKLTKPSCWLGFSPTPCLVSPRAPLRPAMNRSCSNLAVRCGYFWPFHCGS